MFRPLRVCLGLAPLALAASFVLAAAPVRAAANPDTNSALASDSLVAKGKGFEVKRSELDDLYVSYCARSTAQGQPVPDDQREALRSNLLQHIVLGKILTQRATDDDRKKTKDLIDQAIADSKARAGSEENFDTQIKASGMTLDQIRSNAFTEQLPSNVLLRETTKDANISDEAAKKYYDDNPDEFTTPEQVRASHILLLTQDANKQPLPPEKKKEKEKLIKEIRERAVKGEDFAKLAKEYSEDPGSKDKGGEYTFPRHQMVPEFEAAAFSLKTNQISDIVETQYGYHIIKLSEKIPASKVEFAKVEPKIKELLTHQAAEKAAPAYLDSIRAKADVVILDPALTSKPAPATAPAAK
ncbi:MAG TPA: peptidylprolyl isomerase [Verrucomicrobiae bacterium]|nr:peptidylprolyl isomerase [Verrucomicrobiae bacterium]